MAKRNLLWRSPFIHWPRAIDRPIDLNTFTPWRRLNIGSPIFGGKPFSTQSYKNRIHIKSGNINFYLISSQYVILVCEYLFIDIYCRNDSVFFRCLCFGALRVYGFCNGTPFSLCHTLNICYDTLLPLLWK